MKNNKRNSATIIAVIAVMILASVSLCGCGKEAIADIPDPEYFFAETGLIDEINEHDHVKQVILRSNDEVWIYAAAAVTAGAAAETANYKYKTLHKKQTDRQPCPFHFLYSFKRKNL